jgi:PIN domain nuclease of toxin-antitoxin system
MIVLDTPALVCWLSGQGELSDAALAAIERELEGGTIAISAISVLDIAQYVEEGCLSLSIDTRSWLSALASLEGVRVVPVDTAIAVRAATMPFELSERQRLLAATARELHATLVTSDAQLREAVYTESIW